MPAIDLSIDQLLLDSENPQIGTAANQREALQLVLAEQDYKLANLAEDIASNGMSPMDRLLVLRENRNSDRFVSLEGNRRVAVLKILNNPAILTSLTLADALQKRFEKLAAKFERKSVEPVNCYEMASREEARPWILLRHTGENEGRGTVPWESLASRRFLGSDPAQQALEFVLEHGNLSDEEKKSLSKGFPITTLDRLLASTEVRDLLGVEVKNGRLRSGLPGNELLRPLTRIIEDLSAKRINVSDLKNRAQQVEYIKRLGKDTPDLGKLGSLRDVAFFKTTEFKKRATAKKAAGGGYDPSKRKTVAPRTPQLSVAQPKVAEIYHELRKLKMDESPNACAVLLRVFLELSIDSYMQGNGLHPQFKNDQGHMIDKALVKKAEEVIEHLVVSKNQKKKDFDAVTRAITDKSSPLHFKLLHAYVHSLFQTPKPRDLRLAWDEAQPLFGGIWPS